MDDYQSFEEICSLVKSFESCEIKPDDFSHRVHLTAAVFYLSQSGFEEAAKNVKEGLHRFLSHYNLNGYNETITLFWLKVVEDFLRQNEKDISMLDLVNKTVEARGDSKLIFHHYSRELLNTEKAKTSWVEPDLKTLDALFKFS